MPEDILNILDKKGQFVSGTTISSRLGITRAAVWKKVNALRNRGFTIEAVPSRGYRLVAAPDLSRDEISSRLRGNMWEKILVYECLDSTNDFAASLSIKDEFKSGTVIIADRQDKGRGRLGRQWFSPPGENIYMSIILKPGIAPKDATLLTILTAVACTSALRKHSGLPVSIKWPNDLICSGKKMGGILTETRSDPDTVNNAIIGIGINVNSSMRDFPAGIKSLATSMKDEAGQNYSRSRVIIQLLQEFEIWYKLFKKGGHARLLEQWRQFSSTLGREVKVTVGGKTLSGFAEDIDNEGMLILKLPSGDLRKISTGDVSILR